jgi:hypothetical protein
VTAKLVTIIHDLRALARATSFLWLGFYFRLSEQLKHSWEGDAVSKLFVYQKKEQTSKVRPGLQ